MNLEKNLRKEFQKKRKGQALLGQPRFLFGPASGPACLPLILSPARGRASLHPAPATWRPYAGVGRAAAGLQPPLVGTPARAPRPPPSTLSPVSLSPFLLRSHRAAAAAPPRAIAGESPAARRRPPQSLKLDAKSTSALAVARVSSCERSTEVRVRRAP